LPDGQVEILGRLDDQVKIRGVRVEPAEVATVLSAHANVGNCHVGTIRSDDDELQLVAWVVRAQGCSITANELRAHLTNRLPTAFVPAHFVFLSELPLTPNGKLDRKALPSPESETKSAYTAPRNPMEQQLAEIWREVLKLDRVGVHDNFFDLGGHSLIAMDLVAQIRLTFNVELSLRTVFEMPTIENMAFFLLQRQMQHGGSKKVEELLKELDSVSEELST
jgi:acyl carrier protein